MKEQFFCKGCAYYKKPKRPYDLEGNTLFSECRKHAPIAMPNVASGIGVLSVFPTVESDDWCGDFSPSGASVAYAGVGEDRLSAFALRLASMEGALSSCAEDIGGIHGNLEEHSSWFDQTDEKIKALQQAMSRHFEVPEILGG